MLLCIKCLSIPVMYSNPGLKGIITKERYLKHFPHFPQSSNNLRKPHCILPIARHLEILKTCTIVYTLWNLLQFSGLTGSHVVHKCLLMTDKLTAGFQRKAFPPTPPTPEYSASSSIHSCTWQGAQLTAMKFPSLAWSDASVF